MRGHIMQVYGPVIIYIDHDIAHIRGVFEKPACLHDGFPGCLPERRPRAAMTFASWSLLMIWKAETW